MGCEFLGSEYKRSRMDVAHVRDFCIHTGEPCLVDDPLGYVGCTRRTWLLLQNVSPDQPGTHPARIRRGIAKEQGKLL